MTEAGIQVGLPVRGTLSDGREVSNYYLLPTDILHTEGWLPYSDFMPEYDTETQQLSFVRYDVAEDSITAIYEAVSREIPPTPEPTLEERVSTVELTSDEIIDVLAIALGVTI